MLNFVPALVNGGIEAVLYSYISHLDRECIQMDIAVFYGAEEDSIQKAKFEKLGCKVISMKTLLSSPLAHIKEAKEIISNGNYDIVHIHANSALRGIYGTIARHCGIKARIIHAHCSNCDDIKSKIVHRISKTLFVGSCNYRYAVSKAAGEFFFGAKKYDLIPNAINLKRFYYDPESGARLRNELGIAQTDKIIGTIGRKVWVKNQTYIVRIVAEALSRGINLKAVLVGGDGDETNNLTEEIKRQNVEDHIYVIGAVHDAERYYNMFDVFVLPSHHEGISIAGIEAQACGCSCVFSSHVPQDVRMTDNIAFVGIEEQDISKWVDKIVEFLNVPKKDGSEAVRNAGYSIDDAAKLLGSRYEEMSR